MLVDEDEEIFRGSIKEFHKILPVKFFFSDEDRNPNNTENEIQKRRDEPLRKTTKNIMRGM